MVVARLAAVLVTASALGGALVLGTHRVGLRLTPLPAPALAAGLGCARILHVSDLHVRAFGYRERRTLRLAAAARPDLILVTGDLVEPPRDGGPADPGPAITVMRRLAALAPTVAVLGNNDLPLPASGQRVDTPALVAGLAEAEVVVLRNQAALVVPAAPARRPRGRCPAGGPRDAGDVRRPAAGAYVVGVDDNFTGWDDLDAAVRAMRGRAPAILLAHSPDVVVDRDVSRFTLVLAGHTHGGQVRLPLVGTLETQTRARRYVEGLYPLGDRRWLHVSAGVGTSELDLRLLAPPRITVLVPMEG